MKKILILGPDEGYFDSLVSHLGKHFEAEQIVHYSGKMSLGAYFRMVRDILPDVLILDYFALKKNYFELIKILSYQIQKPRKIITLVPGELKNTIGTQSSNGFSTYFIKSQDLEDLIFYIRSMIENNFEVNNVAKAIYTEEIRAETISLVSYINRHEVEIYSNNNFDENKRLSMPIISRFFGDNSLVIKFKGDSPVGVPYKKKYLLTIESLDKNDDDSDLIKKLKTNRLDISYETISVEGYKNFIELTTPKKISLINPGEGMLPAEILNEINPKTLKAEVHLTAKTLFLNWLQRQSEFSKEILRILYYDNDYSALNNPELLDADQDINQVFLTTMDKLEEDILKVYPMLIVVKLDLENTIEKVRELISFFSLKKDYFPYVLIFNYVGMTVEALRDDLQYHFIVASSESDINFGLAFKMIKIFQKKKREKELVKTQKVINDLIKKSPEFEKIKSNLVLDHRITPAFETEESLIFHQLNLELIWISEFEIVFISDQNLSLDEVVIIKSPFRFQVIITPHINDSKESRIKNCYRGTIHWVEEIDKQALRRFVQQASKLSQSDSSLSKDEILQIRRQYFVGFG